MGGDLPQVDPEATPHIDQEVSESHSHIGDENMAPQQICPEISELHSLINEDNVTIEDVEDLDGELAGLLLNQLRKDSAPSVE